MKQISIQCQKDKNSISMISSVKKYINIDEGQPYFPILGEYMHFYNVEKIHKSYGLNNRYKISNITSSHSEFNCDKPSENYRCFNAKIFDNCKKINFYSEIFTKINPILDPLIYIMNQYTPNNHVNSLPYFNKYYEKKFQKINSINNSSYIDCYFSFLGSQLFEKKLCPTFPLYYGSYCGISKKFQFDISEEYDSYKYKKWFVNGQKKRNGPLFILKKNDTYDFDKNFKFYNLEDNILSSVNVENNNMELEIDNNNYDIGNIIDITDKLDEFNLDCMEDINSVSETEDGLSEDIMFAEIKDFPVQAVFMEKLEGTLEDIILTSKTNIMECQENINKSETILGESFLKWKMHISKKRIEKEWCSYLFQVIFGLAVAQKIFGFTHNDLHSSNIMYLKTKTKYFYYMIDDRYYKIPTNGYVLKIIDFGRAIFKVNNKQFFSDVFEYNGDAGGQYTYPINNDKINNGKITHPNMSFDLSRLSVSIIEDLFPLLSNNKKENKLYKLLYSWVIDKYGKDVRRFDDFDLYKIIARRVESAIPKDQLRKKIFDQFVIEENEIPKNSLLFKYIN